MEMDKELCNQVLSQCPTGVLLLDGQRRISWLNPALEQLLGVEAAQLEGKNEAELQICGLAGLFKGSGLMHLLRGGEECWLQCDTSDDGRLSYFQNVTELLQLRETNEQLRQQVRELAITDDLTGLANRQALLQALNAQVTRSRRYHNPLSLALVNLEYDNSSEMIPDAVLLTVSRYLRDRLRWVDVIGRWDNNQFMIILPETSLEDSRELLEKIRQEFSGQQLPDGAEIEHFCLRVGLAEWQKGFDARKLLQQATAALQTPDSPA